MDQEFYKSKQLICIFPHHNAEFEINTYRQSLGLRDLLRIPVCIPLAVSNTAVSQKRINTLSDECAKLRNPDGLLARVSAPLFYRQMLELPYPALCMNVEGPLQEFTHKSRSGLVYEHSPLSMLISMPMMQKNSSITEKEPSCPIIEIRSAYIACLELYCDYAQDSHCICNWERRMIKWIAKLKKS